MRARRRTPVIAAWPLLLASLLPGCDKHDKAPQHAAPSSKPKVATPAPSKEPPPEAPPAEPAAPAASKDKDEAPDSDDALAAGKGPYVMDELADVGPAGPATAGAKGVVMITRDGAVAIAKLDTAKFAHAGHHAIATPIAPVQPGAPAFVALGRGPALLSGYAYWIRGGKLQRRALAGSDKPEVLASDARDGTRVASAPERAGEPPAVAYIAHAANRLHAKLWVQGGGTVDLTPDAGANSVALASTGSGLVAVSLSGRTAMSAVHARTITFSGNKPKLGDDVVVWVGGASQPLTELSAIAAPDRDVWAFLPLERDITHFGLARIEVGAQPSMDSAVTWRDFPNGIDPAPVATARMCGRAAVLYARPSEATPGSPQELHLAALDGDKLGAPVLVAHARAFSDVSVAALPHGGLVSYVADWRTWARTLRCRPRNKR